MTPIASVSSLMRRHDDVRKTTTWAVRRKRLLIEHVKRSPDSTRSQRAEQRILIDNPGTGAVHEHRAIAAEDVSWDAWQVSRDSGPRRFEPAKLEADSRPSTPPLPISVSRFPFLVFRFALCGLNRGAQLLRVV